MRTNAFDPEPLADALKRFCDGVASDCTLRPGAGEKERAPASIHQCFPHHGNGYAGQRHAMGEAVLGTLAGQALSPFELQALVERWCQLFGFLPGEPASASSGETTEPEPADDTMLDVREVERLTGLSESTIERRVKQGLFPKPIKLSARRIGWRASAVKDWVEERDPNRH